MVATTINPARLLTVVVPTLNEAANIAWVLGRMPVEVDEIILGRRPFPPTGTVEGRAPRLRPEPGPGQPTPRGARGAAVLTGDGPWPPATIVIMIDADGSMDPAEIPALGRRIGSRVPTW